MVLHLAAIITSCVSITSCGVTRVRDVVFRSRTGLTDYKSLHIGSFYRPPNSDMAALDNLNISLERLTHRTNGNIWLGGDFNAPHIDWSSMEVSPMAGGRRQKQQRLIDISLENNIEQTIDKPTRGGNILDLLFTNNKSTLQNQDHQIFLNEDLTAARAQIFFEARQLKRRKKITDCWSSYGKIVVKDLQNNISEIR